MALNPRTKQMIVSDLPRQYRAMFDAGEIDDDQLEEYAALRGLAPAVDFSDVAGGSDTESGGPGYVSQRLSEFGEAADSLDAGAEQARQQLGAGIQGMVSGALYQGADNDNPMLTLPATSIDQLGKLASGDFQGLYDLYTKPNETLKKSAVDMRAESDATRKQTEDMVNTIGNPAIRAAVQGGADVLGSPSSLGSLPGGTFAAIPGADAYAQAYMGAREKGLSKEDASTYAATQGASEFAVSAIPAGKFIPGLGKVVSPFASTAVKAITKTGVASLGEGAEEGITNLLQAGLNKATSLEADSKALRDYANAQLPKDAVELWEQTSRAAIAGAVGGAGFTAPTNTFEAVADAGKLSSSRVDVLNESASVAEAAAERARVQTAEVARIAADAEAARLVQGQEQAAKREAERIRIRELEEAPAPSLFGDLEAGEGTFEEQELARQKELETDAAYSVAKKNVPAVDPEAEARAAREQNALDLRTSVARRIDTARSTVEELQDRIDGGDTSSATLNQMAKAVREQSVAERTLENLPVPQPLETAPVTATTGTGDPRTVAIKEVAAPVQTEITGLDQPADPRALALEAARARATKAVEQADNATYKKALATHAAARRKHLNEVNTASAALPAAQRIEAIANANVAWDDANPAPVKPGTLSPSAAVPVVDAPLQNAPQEPTASDELTLDIPTPTPSVAAVAPPRAPSVRAVTPTTPAIETTVTEASVAPKRSWDELRASYKSSGLASTGNPSGTGPAAKAVIDNVFDQVGRSKDANILAKLMADNKLTVVDTATQIPTGAPEGAKGWYDGERMWVTADQIDPANLRGSLMDVVAHETDHAGRVSGNSDVARGGLGGWVGPTSLTGIVAKTRRAASEGNRVAKATVDMVDSLGLNERDAALEVPAYLLNFAKAQGDTSGIVGSLKRDIVAAVRTKYKELTGDANVNLNDVEYLSRKVVERAALTNQSLRGPTGGLDTQGNAMVVGPQSPAFAERKAAGLTYRDADGSEKTLISDRDSELNPDIVRSSSPLRKKLESGEPLKVSDVVTNTAISTGYPMLNDTPVYLDTGLKEGASWYSAPDGTRELRVSQAELDAALTDPGAFHDVVLHELQHGVQEIEDFALGGDPAEFRTPQDLKDIRAANRLTEEHNRITAILKNPGQLDLDPSTEGEVNAIVQQYRDYAITPSEFASDITDALNSDPSLSRMGRTLVKEIDATFPAYAAAKRKTSAIAQRTLEQYLNLHGETEARFTQFNRNRPQSELDAMVAPMYPEGTEVKRDDVALAAGASPVGLAAMPSPKFNELKADITGVGKTLEDRLEGPLRRGVSLFTWRGVNPTKLQLEIDAKEGQAAVGAAIGAKSAYLLRDGINTIADRKFSEGAYKTKDEARRAENARVTKLIDGIIDTAENPDRAEAAIARLVKTEPELQPILDAMNEINLFSEQIIATRARSEQEPTPEELATYNYMLNNRFKYLTRSFAAFQGTAGATRNKRLLAYYEKGKKQLDRGKDMTPKYRESYNIVRKATDFIINNDVAVSDPEHLASLPLESIENLYTLWIENSDLARNRIANDPNVGPSQQVDMFRQLAEPAIAAAVEAASKFKIEAKADNVVRQMLAITPETGSVGRYYRGLKEDTGILEHKETIPQEIKDLFGEITDLPGRIAITMTKQAELASQMRLLTTMSIEGVSQGYIIPNADFGNTPESEKFTATFEGEKWGPLRGMRTTPEIYNGMKDMTEVGASVTEAVAKAVGTPQLLASTTAGSVVKGVRKLSNIQKVAALVLAPAAIAFNAAGSIIWEPIRLGIHPKHLARAMKSGAHLLADVAAPKGITSGPMARSSDVEMIIRNGINDSALAQQLRQSPRELLEQLAVQQQNFTATDSVVSTATKALDMWKGAKKVGAETFALSDSWVKHAAFYSRLEMVEKLNKAEGTNKTSRQMEQEAADMVKDNTITFQRAAPIVKAAELTGLTYVAPYMQTVFRSLTYNYVSSVHDIIDSTKATTPEGRNILLFEGAKRLVGTTAVVAALPMAMKAMAQAFNKGDDEEEIEGMKKFMFTEGRFGDSLYLGKNDKGEGMFLKLSRLDPLGPATDMVRIGLSDETPERKRQLISEAATSLWIKPRTVVAAGSVILSMFGKDLESKKAGNFDKTFPVASNLARNAIEGLPGLDYGDANATMELLDTMYPALLNYVNPNNKAPSDPNGVAGDNIAAAMHAVGGKLDVASPGMAAFSAGKTLSDFRKEQRRAVGDALKTRGIEAATKIAEEGAPKEREMMIRANEIYTGLKQTGMSQTKALEFMKESGGFDGTDLALLRQGRTGVAVQDWTKKYSRLLSERSLTGLGEDKSLSATAQKEADKKRKAEIKALRASGANIQRDSED